MREHRLRTCGYSMGEGRAFHAGGDGKVRSVGVERCGNSRACPVCGPQIAAVRAAEVGAAVWRWMTSSEGRAAVFVSIAASHRASDRLEDLHDQLLSARAAVMRSDCEVWRRFRRGFGIYDLAWKIEHSCGENGPHPGLHLVLLTEQDWTAEQAQAAEAWLVLRFRAELSAAGFTGRLSAEHGIDIRPIDDPAGIGRYLTKWGIGNELAGEHTKLGRNNTSMPYPAIPSVLAHEIGRADPYRRARTDRYIGRLVEGWGDYVRLAVTDKRKWWRGFRKLRTLVPELHGVHRPAEVIVVCTDILPAELRPARHDDAEQEDDDEAEGARLQITGDAWREAIAVWWRTSGQPTSAWARLRYRWTGGQSAPQIPLELAVSWLAEDHGIDTAAEALAALAGGHITRHDHRLTVELPAES